MEKYNEKITILIVILFTTIYSILRYNILGNVEWSQLPLYVSNKIFSFTAVILLSYMFSAKSIQKKKGLIVQQFSIIGYAIFFLIITHIFISILILNPNYFSKFFQDSGHFTILASLSMFFGVISTVLLFSLTPFFRKTIQEKSDLAKIIYSQFSKIFLMFFVALHLFFMGYKGWLTPEKWNGGLPPITLISFAFVIISLIINFSYFKNHEKS